jgi:hypothetical protein
MSSSPDRQSVIRARKLSRKARGDVAQQFAQTKQYLRPQSFVNRWKIQQNEIVERLQQKGKDSLRKSAPVIAIFVGTALLFGARKSISKKTIKTDRDNLSPDQS